MVMMTVNFCIKEIAYRVYTARTNSVLNTAPHTPEGGQKIHEKA